jgi:hypothetical protein
MVVGEPKKCRSSSKGMRQASRPGSTVGFAGTDRRVARWSVEAVTIGKAIDLDVEKL